MLGFSFSSKLDWSSYNIFNAKTAFRKIGAMFRSMKYLYPEVAVFLYKSTMWPCMDYCCHVQAGAPSCFLEMLDKLQKQVCRTVGPSPPTPLKSFSHPQNVTNVSLSFR